MEKKDFKARITWFNEVDSTNSKTRELTRENCLEHGSIVSAHFQASGRGYQGNSWESEPTKNITASWLLRPVFLAPNLQFRLTKIISLSIRDFVHSIVGNSKQVCIKWPNDVYVGDQKIAGVLIENNIMADKISESICGIGININQQKFYSNAPNPVSLSIITGDEYQVDEMIEQLDQFIFQWYGRLQREESSIIDQNYLQALYRLNQFSEFESNGIRFSGYIRGTDPSGRLLIESIDGRISGFDFKEISLIV